MANNLVLGLVIGASLKGSFSAAFGKANKTIENLSNNLGKATQQNEKLGAKMAKWQERQVALHQKMQLAYLSGDQNIGKLTRRYERMQAVIARTAEKQQHFTRAIQSSEKAQKSLSKAIDAQKMRAQNREELKSKIFTAGGTAASIAMPAWGAVKSYITQEEASNNLKIAMMKADGSYGRFDAIDKKAGQLGNKLPGSKADFLRNATSLSEQGVSDEVIENGGLEASANLAVLLNMDQGEGGEFLAKFMEARGLKDSELFEAVDMLQRAKFAGGLSKDQMYGSMSYNATAIRGLGLTGLENTKKLLALEGMNGQQGLEGTSFGTNFSAMLERFNEGPKMIAEAKKGMKAEARDMMESSGVDFQFYDKKTGNFKGIDGALQELMKFEKIKKKFGDEGVGLVAKELFGVEGARVAKVLIEQGAEGLEKFLKKMDQQASITQRIEQKTSTLASSLESLGGVWDSAVGSFGSAFASDIKSLSNDLQGFIENTLTPFINEHKTLIKWGAYVAGGFALLSTVGLSLKFAFSGIASIFSAAFMPFKVFKAIKAAKELETLTGTVTKTGRVMKWLGSAFGVAKKAFIGLGKTLLTNPIGLTITAIAVAAYLIYDNWEPVSAWFSNLWTKVTGYFQNFCNWVQDIWTGATEWVSSAWAGVSDYFGQLWNNIIIFFNSGIGNITATILNWSPLGLFQQVFSTVLSWFGIDMPAKFTEFGSNLINGLVNGIRNAWDGAKEWVISLGQSIKGWFTGEMKIHSPSRVFKGYGENIVSGLAIGIAENALQATQAVDKMGKKVKKAAPKNVAAPAIKAPKMPTVEPLVAKSAVKFEPVLNGIETAFKPLLNEKKGFLGTLWDDVKFGANFVGNLLGLNQSTDFRTPDFNQASGQNPSIFRDYQPLNRNAVTNNETNQHNGIVVNFNPTINVNGSQNQGVLEQVQQGMQMSLYELEKAIERIMDQKMRRAY